MTTYFGFAFSASMLSTDCLLAVSTTTPEQVFCMDKVVSVLNKSHSATIGAIKSRFGLEFDIPEVPPKVELKPGDTMIVAQVMGLPRLVDRHEYTQEEVDNCTIVFKQFYVLSQDISVNISLSAGGLNVEVQ